ncbi:MAG: glycosyltransferase family 4 protein [Acidimicrobiales bacterium]
MVAPPWVRIPPPRYGGTEAVIDVLARGLVAAGHEVVLFASGDSTCPVDRRFLHPTALGTLGSVEDEVLQVQAAYRYLAGQVDIIHDHTIARPQRLLALAHPTPVVHTNHGPFTPDNLRDYERVARRVPVIAISRAQAASAPTVAVATVIHHGIEVDAIPSGDGAGGYVAFLGRMTADKGAHRAVRTARAAGVPIRLAAKMWEPLERAYFAREVEPLLGPDATYVGELGPRAKINLLRGAIALLNPIRWPEPFGLAMVEAMATGTPVLTFREGSAPEIVEDGITGFLCDDVQDLAAAVVKARSIDRAGCRARVRQRFSATRMVEDHVRLYLDVIASHQRRLSTTAKPGSLAGSDPLPVGSPVPMMTQSA